MDRDFWSQDAGSKQELPTTTTTTLWKIVKKINRVWTQNSNIESELSHHTIQSFCSHCVMLFLKTTPWTWRPEETEKRISHVCQFCPQQQGPKLMPRQPASLSRIVPPPPQKKNRKWLQNCSPFSTSQLWRSIVIALAINSGKNHTT